MSTRLNQQLHLHRRPLEDQDRDQGQGRVSSEREVEIGSSNEQREETIRSTLKLAIASSFGIDSMCISWDVVYLYCMRHIIISEIGLRMRIKLDGKEKSTHFFRTAPGPLLPFAHGPPPRGK